MRIGVFRPPDQKNYEFTSVEWYSILANLDLLAQGALGLCYVFAIVYF